MSAPRPRTNGTAGDRTRRRLAAERAARPSTAPGNTFGNSACATCGTIYDGRGSVVAAPTRALEGSECPGCGLTAADAAVVAS